MPTVFTRAARAAAAVGVVGLAVACTEAPVTDPAGSLSFNPTTPPPPERVQVCKDASSPAGTYSFSISQAGGRGGTLLLGSSFTLATGECKYVWEALPDPPASEPDPVVTVTITEVGLPPDVQFASASATDIFGDKTSTTPDISVDVNFYHGALVTYFNEPAPPPPGFEGCTPGYWKNHTDLWPAGYAPGDDFDATFGVDAFSPDITLEDALNLGGGGLRKVARHGAAALLNAAASDVPYPISVAVVIAAVQDAINSGNYEPLASQLAEWNELGCRN